MFDPVAEPLGDQAGIVRKSLGSVARLPAALVLKRLRQVPVIERGKGLDPGLEQFIYQATVEVHALRVGLANPIREDARPGDREPVGLDPHVSHHDHVILVAAIVIDRDVASVPILHLSRGVRIRVRYRLALAIRVWRALNLVGRGGDAPVELFWKSRQSGSRRYLRVATHLSESTGK